MDNNRRIMEWLRDSINHDYAIANRLLELEELCNEEEEPLSHVSLLALTQFFQYRPSLTVNPNGELSATWKFRNYKLIIRFKDNGDIQPLIREIKPS